MAGLALKLLVLKTAQLQRMRAFYGCLGVVLREEQHGGGPVHYAGQTGSVILELYPLAEGITLPDTTTRLGFSVGRLDEVLHALQEQGGIVTHPARQTEWGYRAVVRDPDGRAVELYQA